MSIGIVIYIDSICKCIRGPCDTQYLLQNIDFTCEHIVLNRKYCTLIF